jgi:hypothetical protein
MLERAFDAIFAMNVQRFAFTLLTSRSCFNKRASVKVTRGAWHASVFHILSLAGAYNNRTVQYSTNLY